MTKSKCPCCGHPVEYKENYYDKLMWTCPECGARGDEGFTRKFTGFFAIFGADRILKSGQMDGECGKCPVCGGEIDYPGGPGEIDGGFRFCCLKCHCEGVEGFDDEPDGVFTNVVKGERGNEEI